MAKSASFADDLQTDLAAIEEVPGPLVPFPYPKSRNSLRWLHVAAPEELIVLRTAAGHLIQFTDTLLSPRVCSNRLDYGRCWNFRPVKEAWPEFRRLGLSMLDGRRYSAMYRTDVQAYYPSIDIDRVGALLKRCGCLVPAASLILKIFGNWQLRDGLQGLPIGPEASGVIGNFLLHPIDRSLEANRYEHIRWSDDILIFGRTIASCAGSLVVLDETLSNLGLARSIKKTLDFDNVNDARGNVSDYWITSLTDVLSIGNDVGREALRWAYDSQIRDNPDVKPHRFRWVLRALKNKFDPYACVSLAREPSLMNVDPRLSGQYLGAALENRKATLDDRKATVVVNAMMDCICKPPEDLFDALDLHLLKALKGRRFGDAEAKKFKSIATDSSRRWPVRVYGWAAYVGTTQRYPELMEAARAEPIPQ